MNEKNHLTLFSNSPLCCMLTKLKECTQKLYVVTSQIEQTKIHAIHRVYHGYSMQLIKYQKYNPYLYCQNSTSRNCYFLKYFTK